METKFVPEFYHTYNRGVEKRKIFLDNQDFFRAAHDLYEFNDKKGIINLGKRIKKTGNPISINKNRKEELIDIVA